MNPLDIPLWAKVLAVIALVGALIGGFEWYRHDLIQQGVTQEKARRDKIDAENTAKAQAELGTLNSRMRALQAELTAAQADLANKQQELQNAKAESDHYQSELRAGTKRMRVLVANRPTCEAGHAAGTAAANVDSGTSVTADLDPAVAGDLVGLTAEGDTAIRRLNGCITAYDAVKAAADQAAK